MTLARTDIAIDTLLSLMEAQEPESIQLNHVVIDGGLLDIQASASLDRLPLFTVMFAGFVEVEMYMDLKHEQVVRITVRQAAMTFSELTQNGDVLPTLTINCKFLSSADRVRLNLLAQSYIASGKILDKSRAEALLTQYVEKAMFCSRKYGAMSHA